MTPKQREYKQNLITKIQINKSNVFSDENVRKEFMQSRFGAKSLKDMSIDQLKLLLDFCYRKVSDIPMLHQVEDKELITQAQVEKIRTVWMEKARDKSEEALLSFVFRISKYKLQRLEDLLKGKATKVIVALELI
ncbi:phage protein GemA/Gp16 family protein [Halarcobacter sp.]|uniref:phage protein GemA/Gp16 family protein n=1 Tax=Halarcobacter sp. TaxID=2321133 RepID=UPI0029F4DCC6|nr:phage protein GemA/Gp16 family protein [Halarcobacter sp.]